MLVTKNRAAASTTAQNQNPLNQAYRHSRDKSTAISEQTNKALTNKNKNAVMDPDKAIANAGLAVSPSQPISKRLSEMGSSRRTLVLERASDAPEASQRGYLAAACGIASPRAAIKAFCLMCVYWQRPEVTLCTAEACPLWAFRPFQPCKTGKLEQGDGMIPDVEKMQRVSKKSTCPVCGKPMAKGSIVCNACPRKNRPVTKRRGKPNDPVTVVDS